MRPALLTAATAELFHRTGRMPGAAPSRPSDEQRRRAAAATAAARTVASKAIARAALTKLLQDEQYTDQLANPIRSTLCEIMSTTTAACDLLDDDDLANLDMEPLLRWIQKNPWELVKSGKSAESAIACAAQVFAHTTAVSALMAAVVEALLAPPSSTATNDEEAVSAQSREVELLPAEFALLGAENASMVATARRVGNACLMVIPGVGKRGACGNVQVQRKRAVVSAVAASGDEDAPAAPAAPPPPLSDRVAVAVKLYTPTRDAAIIRKMERALELTCALIRPAAHAVLPFERALPAAHLIGKGGQTLKAIEKTMASDLASIASAACEAEVAFWSVQVRLTVDTKHGTLSAVAAVMPNVRAESVDVEAAVECYERILPIVRSKVAHAFPEILRAELDARGSEFKRVQTLRANRESRRIARWGGQYRPPEAAAPGVPCHTWKALCTWVKERRSDKITRDGARAERAKKRALFRKQREQRAWYDASRSKRLACKKAVRPAQRGRPASPREDARNVMDGWDDAKMKLPEWPWV